MRLVLRPLLALALCSLGSPLAAQTAANAIGIAIGGIGTHSNGQTAAIGISVGVGARRSLSGHFTLRLDAEYQWLAAHKEDDVVYIGCSGLPGCGFPSGAPAPVRGVVRSGSLLGGLEWSERADRRGVFLLAGLGPRYRFSHPDAPRTFRLILEGGAGAVVAVGSSALVLEFRYQRQVGSGVPLYTVPVTLGWRMELGH